MVLLLKYAAKQCLWLCEPVVGIEGDNADAEWSNISAEKPLSPRATRSNSFIVNDAEHEVPESGACILIHQDVLDILPNSWEAGSILKVS